MNDKTKNSVKVKVDDKKPIVDEEKQNLEKERDQYKNHYLRAVADYRNLEKRMNEERGIIRDDANRFLIMKLLPFLDSLYKAEFFIKDTGLKITKDSFLKTLKDEGLEEIEVMGKEYNPYTAEVIDMVPGEKDNMVAEVLRKGYQYKGKILRVAQVKVTKKK